MKLKNIFRGVQILPHTSTGGHNHYQLSHISVTHALPVYITVIAVNGAGLTQAVYSDPLTVDLTPPNITDFQVNNGALLCSKDAIPLTWKSEDIESNVEDCHLSLGTSITQDDIVPMVKLAASGSRALIINVTSHHGKQVYVNLQCKNYVNLVTRRSFGPIKIVNQPPSIKSAQLKVIPVKQTYYPQKEGVLSSTDEVWLMWSGFHDPSAIKSCQTAVHQSSSVLLDWSKVGNMTERVFALQNFTSFRSGLNYTAGVKCTNRADLTSEVLHTQFSIQSEPPSYNGGIPVFTWLSESAVNITWNGLFNSATSLVYEVHVGTVIGGADVLRWIETKSPFLKVEKLDHSTDHYITITAVNSAAMFITNTFKFSK